MARKKKRKGEGGEGGGQHIYLSPDHRSGRDLVYKSAKNAAREVEKARAKYPDLLTAGIESRFFPVSQILWFGERSGEFNRTK